MIGMRYFFSHIHIKTAWVAICFFLIAAQLKAQGNKTAPVINILLNEVDAKLSLPNDGWEKGDNSMPGNEQSNFKSIFYRKNSKLNGNESEMTLMINIIEKKTDAVGGLLKEFGKLLGASDENKEEADQMKQMLAVNYKVNDLSSSTQPVVKDFKNATVLELRSIDNPESGYFVTIKKENTIAQLFLFSTNGEYEKNLPELMAILKSISRIKNIKTQDSSATVKSGVKLPATALCDYFPVCDGYTYTYVEDDPVLGKVTHTKLYEKVTDKIVKGKKFMGFLVHCTNPFLDGRYEYYNFENGVLSSHKENEEFTTNSYEEYNVFNPSERRTSYETQLQGKNNFTTLVVLKTNSPEGSSWSEKKVNAGYATTFKYTILEKGVTVKVGNNSYPNVIVVEQEINADITATSTKVHMMVKMYYAKGAGLIKTVIEKANGDLTESLMETFAF